MTALYPKHAFNVAPGEPQLSPLAKFFRWVLRGSQRRPAVPAGLRPAAVLRAAGAATILVSDAEPAWPLSADMPTGEFARLDEKFEALYRPVNGRYLGTQPRRLPVHGEAPVATVLQAERDAAREAGERARVRYQPARPELLKQVLTGLKKL